VPLVIYNGVEEKQVTDFLEKIKELVQDYPGTYQLWIALRSRRIILYPRTSTQRRLILVLEKFTKEILDTLVTSLFEEGTLEQKGFINTVDSFLFDEKKEPFVSSKKRWFKK